MTLMHATLVRMFREKTCGAHVNRLPSLKFEEPVEAEAAGNGQSADGPTDERSRTLSIILPTAIVRPAAASRDAGSAADRRRRRKGQPALSRFLHRQHPQPEHARWLGLPFLTTCFGLPKPDAKDDPEARLLARRLYGLMSRVRITDLLEEVDKCTGFTEMFGHVQTGRSHADRRAFLAALIDEATRRIFFASGKCSSATSLRTWA